MAYQTKLLNSEDYERGLWDEYYKGIDQKCVYHSPDYFFLIGTHFKGQPELFIFEDENNYIYYPYLKHQIPEALLPDAWQNCGRKHFDISSSWYYGGPLIKNKQEKTQSILNAFHVSFQSYCKQNHIISEFIRFDTNLKNHMLYPVEETEYNRETVFIDLKAGIETVEKGFSDANRRAVKKALKKGYVVCEASNTDQDRWEKFEEIYTQEMVRKKAPEHLYFSSSFFNSLRQMPESSVRLLTVEKDDEVVGGFIICFDAEYAFHFLSASHPSHWDGRVNNLMFSKAAEWACEYGCKIFDFMGGRPGVFRFKSNFSKTRGRFYCLKKIHNKETYQTLLSVFEKRNGVTNLNFFPAYRVVL